MSSDPSLRPTIIVGGGISGLSAAYALAKDGRPSVLIDPSARLGGVIQTDTVSGCVLEAGPDSFLSAKPEAMELIRELGLADEVIGSNDHQRATWIWRNARMIPLPDGLMMMVPTRILPTMKSSLLSWGTKMRMGMELLRAPQPGRPDRSVGEFIEDHYGTEAVTYLAEPLLSGVYGGDPYKLSVQSVLPRFAEMEANFGSLTKGTLAGMAAAPKREGGTLFRTLKRGLGSLVEALEIAIAPHCRVIREQAVALTRDSDGYAVRLDNETLRSADVIVAAPAWAASSLLRSLDANLAAALARIDYSSSMTIGAIYDRADVPVRFKAFGFLVPKPEREYLLACTFIDQKFNHRVPEDKLLLRCFLGGAGGEGMLSLSDAELKRAVLRDLQRLLGITAKPVAFHVSRWPRSMAQYNVGHAKVLDEIESRRLGYPGLELAGNGYLGIGIPDCIRSGKEAAKFSRGR